MEKGSSGSLNGKGRKSWSRPDDIHNPDTEVPPAGKPVAPLRNLDPDGIQGEAHVRRDPGRPQQQVFEKRQLQIENLQPATGIRERKEQRPRWRVPAENLQAVQAGPVPQRMETAPCFIKGSAGDEGKEFPGVQGKGVKDEQVEGIKGKWKDTRIRREFRSKAYAPLRTFTAGEHGLP